MAKVNKTEKIRQALEKNPNSNVKELAEKIGISTNAVYKVRRKMAAETGEAPTLQGRRGGGEVTVNLEGKRLDKVSFVPATTPIGSPLLAQVAVIERIGVDRVKIILGLLES